MARLNDNLFTTLLSFAKEQEEGCFLQTKLGCVRIGFSSEGLTSLVFEDEMIRREYMKAAFRDAFQEWVHVFASFDAAKKWSCLDLDGTDFQMSVWRALLEIPFGGSTSYGAIAAQLDRPKAYRAVGSAVGANPVSLLVPCHRVLPSTGKSGNYRWGAERKLALLDLEQESGSDLGSLVT